jgi:Flp pilus assembly pilin Flp
MASVRGSLSRGIETRSRVDDLNDERAHRCSGRAAPKEEKVQKLHPLFAEFPRREEGQTMAEYGVVLAVITIAVFGALALLSGNIVNAVNRVAGYIT